MLKADENGKYPLKMREYGSLLTLFGMSVLLDGDKLKERLQTIPNGWRDMRLIVSLLDKVKDELLSTVPDKKLRAIQTELRHSVCELKINPPTVHSSGCVYVNQEALVKLADRAIDTECILCEKSSKECLKCELYNAINDCFPYETMREGAEYCPFAGAAHLTVGDDQIT